jgi:histidinol phosphatase-like PHP family hydrolase
MPELPDVQVFKEYLDATLLRQRVEHVHMSVLHAAKEHRVAVELNANPERLDLSDLHVSRARELGAAKEHRVAVELNANPERLDLSDLHVSRARELGVPVVISTDAHSPDNLRAVGGGPGQTGMAGEEERSQHQDARAAPQVADERVI